MLLNILQCTGQTYNYKLSAQIVTSAEAENLSLVWLLLVYLSHNGSFSLIHIYTLSIQFLAHALCSKKDLLTDWLTFTPICFDPNQLLALVSLLT